MRGFNFFTAMLMGRRVCGRCHGEGIITRLYPQRGGYREVNVPCPECKGKQPQESDHANRSK